MLQAINFGLSLMFAILLVKVALTIAVVVF